VISQDGQEQDDALASLTWGASAVLPARALFDEILFTPKNFRRWSWCCQPRRDLAPPIGPLKVGFLKSLIPSDILGSIRHSGEWFAIYSDVTRDYPNQSATAVNSCYGTRRTGSTPRGLVGSGSLHPSTTGR
jgi:hypothetical protein